MSRKPLHGDASVMRIRFVHKRLMSASVSRRDEPPWIHEGLVTRQPVSPRRPLGTSSTAEQTFDRQPEGVEEERPWVPRPPMGDPLQPLGFLDALLSRTLSQPKNERPTIKLRWFL